MIELDDETTAVIPRETLAECADAWRARFAEPNPSHQAVAPESRLSDVLQPRKPTVKNSELYKLAAVLLRLASDMLKGQSGRDINLALLVPSVDERRALVKAHHDETGDPQHYNDTRTYTTWFDWMLMRQIANQLRERGLSAELVEGALAIPADVQTDLDDVAEQIVTAIPAADLRAEIVLQNDLDDIDPPDVEVPTEEEPK